VVYDSNQVAEDAMKRRVLSLLVTGAVLAGIAQLGCGKAEVIPGCTDSCKKSCRDSNLSGSDLSDCYETCEDVC
jgi:hypothetical protein